MALITAVLAIAEAGCAQKPSEAPLQAAPTLTVELVSPKRESWALSLPASGQVAAWQEASVGAEIGGARLDQVLVDVGDQVKQGQLLAHFDEDTLKVELAQLDAALAEAQANLGKAKADADRANVLEQTGALSRQDIQLMRTQAATATARVASAKAQRDAQALRLRYAHVLAPDDGLISSRTATVGAVLAPGTELFRLIRGGRLEWRAQVRSDSLSKLHPGLQVRVKRDDGSTISGTVRQIAPSLDKNTLNGLAYVDLPRDSGFADGMFVSGEFLLDHSPAVTLPESAIVLRDGSRYLMRVDADSKVHEVKVETGRRENGAIEIFGKIEDADRFVVSGGAFLNDGDAVSVARNVAGTP